MTPQLQEEPMTTEGHRGQAERAASNVLDVSEVTLPILTRELAVALLATAWLHGYGAGAERVRAITMEVLAEELGS